MGNGGYVQNIGFFKIWKFTQIFTKNLGKDRKVYNETEWAMGKKYLKLVEFGKKEVCFV